ncbi:MAG: glucuronate isomerase [Cyclobacteriaceae bacterium]|nr:glucuronate isomerase [Cyclobacteriaceae bacterium]
MSFITEDFLLTGSFAKKLYHDYAENLPIIDYHNHLSPADIASNRKFENLTRLWLEGDHYKWRAMRTLGIEEDYITGLATDEEKFYKWAYTVPYTLRNPLYHWTHLELKRYFGITAILNPQTAEYIYQTVQEKLQADEFRARGLLQKMCVELLCTTDDPIDDLSHHQQIKKEEKTIRVLPAFRPDNVWAFNDPNYPAYLQKLSATTEITINRFADLLEALEKRINYFHTQGCRIADHGLECLPLPARTTSNNTEVLFSRVLRQQPLTEEEKDHLTHSLLTELCKMYHARGWVQQFHLGALRNVNTRLLKRLGPNTGFDSIGDFSQATSLAAFLNHLDKSNQLTKTILYNLNPAQNEVFAAMIGNFNDGSVKGKIQWGAAWWFLDQKDGIERHLQALSNLSLLSCFIGMVTDSRSFLSFPRHEYFRRILCNLIGRDVDNGELPADEKWLGKLVADICYHNAKLFFNFSCNDPGL